MKFGRTPVEKAAGHILAHSVAAGGKRHAKGTLIDARLQASLRAAGLSSIWTAEIEAGDVPEDEAAVRLARHIAGAGLDLSDPSKGRVNLTAAGPGLLRIDRDAFRVLTTLDESLALASLPAMRRVEAGQLVATLKIIPYAVAETLLEKALASGRRGILSLAPFRTRKTGLILTRTTGMPAKLLDKSREALEARLRALHCGIVKATVRDHHEEAVAEAVSGTRAAGAELIIILGASATIDRADLVPRGIEQAGGVIGRFGLPVDPGNLLMTARLDEADIIVAPGCARSPLENGFDWVLERIVADLPVTKEDYADMAQGGLLKEGALRPTARRAERKSPETPQIAALLLAAGASRRMGNTNKLLEEVENEALVMRAARKLTKEGFSAVITVTGHEADRVRQALATADVQFVHNPDHETGLASSIRAGVRSVPDSVDWLLVALGDMPDVAPSTIKNLLARAAVTRARILIPAWKGRRGNPVLWHRSLFPRLEGLSGDEGARQLLPRLAGNIEEVPVEDPGITLDIDTEERLAERRKNGRKPA